MIRQFKKYRMAVLTFALGAMHGSTALIAATVPYTQDFSGVGIPGDFATQTVNGSYAAATNRWGVASQALVHDVPAADPAGTRGTAQVQLPNAFDLLTAGNDIVMSVDIRIPAYFSSGVMGIGPRMFTDASGTGSSGAFYGLHGWELNWRQNPTFGSSALKLAIYDYGGTTGTGSGAAYIAGSIATGGSGITGLTFSTSETYSVTMTASLIQAADIILNGGTELDADLGKVRLNLDFEDPDGDDVTPGLQPFTVTLSGVSLATALLNSGTGENFGFVTNNVSTGGAQTVVYDNFSVTAVPEPGSIVFAGIALTGLAIAALKKRR